MTTNFELIKMGKLLGLRDLQVLMLDEILYSCRFSLRYASLTVAPDSGTSRERERTAREARERLNLIVNLNASDNNVNGHWTLAYVDDFQKIFYCPYGSSAPLEVNHS